MGGLFMTQEPNGDGLGSGKKAREEGGEYQRSTRIMG